MNITLSKSQLKVKIKENELNTLKEKQQIEEDFLLFGISQIKVSIFIDEISSHATCVETNGTLSILIYLTESELYQAEAISRKEGILIVDPESLHEVLFQVNI